jgi:hypothetical protein
MGWDDKRIAISEAIPLRVETYCAGIAGLFRRGEEASQISYRGQVSQPFGDWGIQSKMML